LEWPETLPALGRSGAGVQQKVKQMDRNSMINTAATISEQLSEEGAAKRVYDAALAETKGQFANTAQDKNAACLVLAEAFAMALSENTSRPQCCDMHKSLWLGGAIKVVVEMFGVFVGKRDAG
jgi:hypothetical protein